MRPEGPFHVKYRPISFSEIVGNEETVESITGVLTSKDCPHLFLLTGPSGCGKTTIGRLIKNYLGCSDLDFKELNAANTRGIDTIREVVTQCGYSPMAGKSRVYLLDECHQLTGTAMEALLKVTEDVPSHVYFILSTTNPEKLIATLKNRCAQYQVKSLLRKDIIKLIHWVLYEEGIGQEDVDYFNEVVTEIAKLAEGSPRQALVMLGQVIDLEKEKALELLRTHPLVGEEQVIGLCQKLLGPEGWDIVAKVVDALEGDPEQIRRQVLGYMSRVLINRSDPRAAGIIKVFSQPFYDTGKPGLILACYLVKGVK